MSINRAELRLTVASIRSHLDIVDKFLDDHGSDRECELEILGRCTMIDERITRLRIGVTTHAGEHVTGQRLAAMSDPRGERDA